MKAWKGWMEHDKFVDTTKEDGNRPVLVIDASDFPDGYPMIDSERLYMDRSVRVVGSPFKGTAGVWMVTVQGKDRSFVCDIDSLKPLPKTATGEVVGTITFGDEATSWGTDNAPIPHGTYDIIKRGDK